MTIQYNTTSIKYVMITQYNTTIIRYHDNTIQYTSVDCLSTLSFSFLMMASHSSAVGGRLLSTRKGLSFASKGRGHDLLALGFLEVFVNVLVCLFVTMSPVPCDL